MGLRRRLLKELLSSLKYIKNLTESQISASLWKGETVLHDLELDPEELQLFFHDLWPCGLQILKASVKEVRVRIPWSQIMSQSILVLVKDVEVEAEAHCEDDMDWQEVVVRMQRNYLKRREAKLRNAKFSAASTGARGAFEQLHQRLVDGLQMQVSKATLSIRSRHGRHIPSHLKTVEDAPQPHGEVLIFVGEDIIMSPADDSRAPCRALKDVAMTCSETRTLQFNKFLKCGAFNILPGSYPNNCRFATSTFFEQPVTVMSHTTTSYPSDGTCTCPFVKRSDMSVEFVSELRAKGCECQLRACMALAMDVSKLEGWRSDASLLCTASIASQQSPGQAASPPKATPSQQQQQQQDSGRETEGLVNTSSMARAFARGKSLLGTGISPAATEPTEAATAAVAAAAATAVASSSDCSSTSDDEKTRQAFKTGLDGSMGKTRMPTSLPFDDSQHKNDGADRDNTRGAIDIAGNAQASTSDPGVNAVVHASWHYGHVDDTDSIAAAPVIAAIPAGSPERQSAQAEEKRGDREVEAEPGAKTRSNSSLSPVHSQAALSKEYSMVSAMSSLERPGSDFGEGSVREDLDVVADRMDEEHLRNEPPTSRSPQQQQQQHSASASASAPASASAAASASSLSAAPGSVGSLPSPLPGFGSDSLGKGGNFGPLQDTSALARTYAQGSSSDPKHQQSQPHVVVSSSGLSGSTSGSNHASAYSLDPMMSKAWKLLKHAKPQTLLSAASAAAPSLGWSTTGSPTSSGDKKAFPATSTAEAPASFESTQPSITPPAQQPPPPLPPPPPQLSQVQDNAVTHLASDDIREVITASNNPPAAAAAAAAAAAVSATSAEGTNFRQRATDAEARATNESLHSADTAEGLAEPSSNAAEATTTEAYGSYVPRPGPPSAEDEMLLPVAPEEEPSQQLQQLQLQQLLPPLVVLPTPASQGASTALSQGTLGSAHLPLATNDEASPVTAVADEDDILGHSDEDDDDEDFYDPEDFMSVGSVSSNQDLSNLSVQSSPGSSKQPRWLIPVLKWLGNSSSTSSNVSASVSVTMAATAQPTQSARSDSAMDMAIPAMDVTASSPTAKAKAAASAAGVDEESSQNSPGTVKSVLRSMTVTLLGPSTFSLACPTVDHTDGTATADEPRQAPPPQPQQTQPELQSEEGPLKVDHCSKVEEDDAATSKETQPEGPAYTADYLEWCMDGAAWSSESTHALNESQKDCFQRFENRSEEPSLRGPVQEVDPSFFSMTLTSLQTARWPTFEFYRWPAQLPSQNHSESENERGSKQDRRLQLFARRQLSSATAGFSLRPIISVVWEPTSSPGLGLQSDGWATVTWPMHVSIENAEFCADPKSWMLANDCYVRCKSSLGSKLPTKSMVSPRAPANSGRKFPKDVLAMELLDCEIVEPTAVDRLLEVRRFPYRIAIPYLRLQSHWEIWNIPKLLEQWGTPFASCEAAACSSAFPQQRGEATCAPVDGPQSKEVESNDEVTLPKETFDFLVQRCAEATRKEAQYHAAREELQKVYISLASKGSSSTSLGSSYTTLGSSGTGPSAVTTHTANATGSGGSGGYGYAAATAAAASSAASALFSAASHLAGASSSKSSHAAKGSKLTMALDTEATHGGEFGDSPIPKAQPSDSHTASSSFTTSFSSAFGGFSSSKQAHQDQVGVRSPSTLQPSSAEPLPLPLHQQQSPIVTAAAATPAATAISPRLHVSKSFPPPPIEEQPSTTPGTSIGPATEALSGGFSAGASFASNDADAGMRLEPEPPHPEKTMVEEGRDDKGSGQIEGETAAPPHSPQRIEVLAELERLRRRCSQLESTLLSQSLTQRRLETELTSYQALACEELQRLMRPRQQQQQQQQQLMRGAGSSGRVTAHVASESAGASG